MDAASQGISPLRPVQLSHLTTTVTPAPRGAVTPGAGSDLAGTPGGTAARLLHLSPAAATAAMMKEGMSLTEIYSKYAEAADAWRQERIERKRLQAQVDKIFEELEQKAPAINAQREEYERLLESHARLTAQLEQAAHVRRRARRRPSLKRSSTVSEESMTIVDALWGRRWPRSVAPAASG